MVLTPSRRLVTVILCSVALVATSACGGGGNTVAAPTTASTKSTASPDSQTYSSKAFTLPLTVAVDGVLKSPPTLDSRNLLSWDAVASSDNKVRFLVPVVVYRPGSATPEALPKDYLTYIQGFTHAGAEISEVSKTAVGGHPATLMNLAWNSDAEHPEGYFDGALGCPTATADQAEGCFGPQPELLLRLAIIDVGNTTLIAWARLNRENPDQAFVDVFERMLTTVEFL